MLKTKPAVFAKVSHETRQVRDSVVQKARPIRVLLIAPSLDIIGGQSIQANQLLQCFANEPSVQIQFLPVNPRLRPALRMKYLRTLITLVFYLVRLASQIRRADALHIFAPGFFSFYLWPLPALIAARLLGKRAILNYHDGRAEDHLAHWPAARRLLRLASAVVVPSDYLVDVFARFELRAVRIHNIVETGSWRYRERPQPRPMFLHNRGLAPEYNPACTLRAFAIVQQRYPEASLTVVHDGPLRVQLEALAAWLGLRNTRFTGAVSAQQMASLYDASDIYLMSPNADNMPLSVLECFASGLPVVSSRAGGVPNMVEDQRTGLLFPPNDHQAMARSALRLIEEPGLASWLAANARKACERYAWPDIGPQWIAQYCQPTGASGRASKDSV
ncbi:MAG TPA: glycosyltransferase family 4 protein [Bryobacteraceae bacterium]|nr:glycosyltransferase family 4 protein [Bryobacteraceae bacterium]